MLQHARLALLLPLVWTPSDGVAQGTVDRRYQGAEVPVRIDGTRLVVRLGAATSPARGLEIVRGLGIEATAVDSTGVPAWFFVDLGRALPDSRAVRRAVARLAAHASVEFASPVLHGVEGHWAAITPEILLRLRTRATDPRGLVEEVTQLGSCRVSAFGGISRSFTIRHAEKDGFVVLDAANRLAVDARVEWAEPDWMFSGRGRLIPNDPGWANLWGMRNTGQFSGVPGMDMDADLAWDLNTGSAGVRVLIIDTGVQQNHPDIHQVPGVDLTGQGGAGGPVNSCDNHGTPVAGCVSAILNNNRGTVGIAPNCRSLSARAFISTSSCNGSWSSRASWTVDALEQGRQRGCRITNNSNGYGFRSAAIESKYASTKAQGMIHFASAGNNGSTTVTYPSSLSSVFAVAALTSRGVLAGFSNRGNSIYISAPGWRVYSTDRTGSAGYSSGAYASVNGTSFASPYTAGVAALLLSRKPGMTVRHLELALRATRDLGLPGWDSTYGWGFLNANAALRCTPYGTGHPGTGGIVPELFAQGLPRINQPMTIRTARARRGASGLLALGGRAISVPFLGGRLLVGPSYVLVPQTFSGDGTSALSFRIPNQASLIGARAFLQSGIPDVGASQGLALSNAIEILIGP